MGMTIIKNYGIPDNCYMCDLHNYHECDLTGESIEEDYCWNGDSREKHCPLREVEAIPKAEVKKFLEEGTKDVGNNVLAIVREDYIHKADYENRLRADMVAMLTDIQLEIEESEPLCNECDYAIDDCTSRAKVNNIIQQKINSLKEV